MVRWSEYPEEIQLGIILHYAASVSASHPHPTDTTLDSLLESRPRQIGQSPGHHQLTRHEGGLKSTLHSTMKISCSRGDRKPEIYSDPGNNFIIREQSGAVGRTRLARIVALDRWIPRDSHFNCVPHVRGSSIGCLPADDDIT